MQEVVLSRSHRKALLKEKGENAGYKPSRLLKEGVTERVQININPLLYRYLF